MTRTRPSAGEPLEEFERRLSARFVRRTGPAVEDRHIALMLHTLKEEPLSPIPLRSMAARRVLIAVAATLGLSTVSTGLAFAGVITLPEPAQAALRSIGLNLPEVPANEQPSPEERPSARPTATPSDATEDRPDSAPSETPAERPSAPSQRPTTPPENLPDQADPRASLRGDNADARSSDGADNADDPGSQSDDRADNANPRAEGGADNANARGGDSAP